MSAQDDYDDSYGDDFDNEFKRIPTPLAQRYAVSVLPASFQFCFFTWLLTGVEANVMRLACDPYAACERMPDWTFCALASMVGLLGFTHRLLLPHYPTHSFTRWTVNLTRAATVYLLTMSFFAHTLAPEVGVNVKNIKLYPWAVAGSGAMAAIQFLRDYPYVSLPLDDRKTLKSSRLLSCLQGCSARNAVWPIRLAKSFRVTANAAAWMGLVFSSLYFLVPNAIDEPDRSVELAAVGVATGLGLIEGVIDNFVVDNCLSARWQGRWDKFKLPLEHLKESVATFVFSNIGAVSILFSAYERLFDSEPPDESFWLKEGGFYWMPLFMALSAVNVGLEQWQRFSLRKAGERQLSAGHSDLNAIMLDGRESKELGYDDPSAFLSPHNSYAKGALRKTYGSTPERSDGTPILSPGNYVEFSGGGDQKEFEQQGSASKTGFFSRVFDTCFGSCRKNREQAPRRGPAR